MTTNMNVGVPKPAWLPEELYQMWVDAYIESGGTGVVGSAGMATELVRQSNVYENFFPGIKRDDGSIRYPSFPEATYLNNLESYRNTLASAGLNPSVFEQDYVALISGDVSPQEFNNRIESLNARVVLAGEDIRNYYADSFGLEMTDQAILGSLLSDRVGDAILSRQITMAEIGGEAALRDFDLSTQFVEMLAEGGMDRNDAQRLFGSAASLVPALQALASRHGDPDDSFDITEFVEGAYLADPKQSRRIRRLQATEASTFTGGAAVEFARSRTGGVTGLMDV